MLEEFVKAAVKKIVAEDYPHMTLPPVVFARITAASQPGETFELGPLIIHNEDNGSSFRGRIEAHWNEYTLAVIDRFGNTDETYPQIPGARSKAQYAEGATVAVAFAYGDAPVILGEVSV